MVGLDARYRGGLKRDQHPIDLSTSAGRLQLHLLAAFAQFEREGIRERIHLGQDRARKQGKKLGRRARRAGEPLTVRQAAALWGVSKLQATRRMAGPQLGLGTSALLLRWCSGAERHASAFSFQLTVFNTLSNVWHL